VSKIQKSDNKPITALFASHFKGAKSLANWLYDLIRTRQGSNLQSYDPKSKESFRMWDPTISRPPWRRPTARLEILSRREATLLADNRLLPAQFEAMGPSGSGNAGDR
jgi:hypothetical protein